MENALSKVSTWNFANYLIMAYYWLSVVYNSNSKHKKPLFVVWDFSMAIFEKSLVFTGSGTTMYLLQSLFGYFTLSFIAHGY